MRLEDTSEREGWRPAAGAFDSWPEHLGDLKVLDPVLRLGALSGRCLLNAGAYAHGAGGLHCSRRGGRSLAGQPAWTGTGPALRRNSRLLHWLSPPGPIPRPEGYRPLPELNLACSGLAPNATKEEWTALSEQAAAAGGVPPARDLSAPLRNSLGALHDLFGQAPELGSLINPRTLEDNLFQRAYESVRTLFAAVLARERTSDEQTEHAVTAQGMARAAELLAGSATTG